MKNAAFHQKRNLIGNESLAKVGIDVPHSQTKKTSRIISFITTVEKDREIEQISKTFKHLFIWMGKIKTWQKLHNYHEPLKFNQLKSECVPVLLLDSVKTELCRFKIKRQIKNQKDVIKIGK